MLRSVRSLSISQHSITLMQSSNFAANIKLKFHTPEEYFLQEAPRPFTRVFEHSEYLLSAKG